MSIATKARRKDELIRISVLAGVHEDKEHDGSHDAYLRMQIRDKWGRRIQASPALSAEWQADWAEWERLNARRDQVPYRTAGSVLELLSPAAHAGQ